MMITKLKYLFPLLSLLCISCHLTVNEPKASNITSNFIFDQMVTNSCHAATLVELEPNRLMSAWFGGSYEGAKDVGIYSSFYDGKSWSNPVLLVEPIKTSSDTLPCWNPVLFKSKHNKLYLFYKVGKNPRTWHGAMKASENDGRTWSAVQYLPNGMLGPIKNKPIEIEPGIILCGSSTENPINNQWRVHVELYNEASNEWQKIPVDNPKDLDIIQPTFLVHQNDDIQMLCRSKHNKIVTSWSTNKGMHWKHTDSMDVVNSNSGIDALTIGKNNFLLVNNPLPQGPDWFYGRNVLDVEYSSDGLQWQKLLNLENEPKGEFSYPAIIQTTDGTIHVVYTYNRKYIKHVSFHLN